MITKEEWEKFLPARNPFLKFEFFNALIQSGSVSEKTGWVPKFFSADKTLLYCFIKFHSYGEFIFDWNWAEAFDRYGIPYYPKLLSMVPLTPVNAAHFLQKEENPVAFKASFEKLNEFYKGGQFSSLHFLFITEDEREFFKAQGFHIRETFQYHFYNLYETFEDFLQDLKGKKAKQFRKERQLQGITIRKITGEELTEAHARRMYRYYIATISSKNSFDYLNEEFFVMVFETMKESILLVEAYRDEKPIAGSLFFYDDYALYGRYWGSFEQVEHLHFELCYYQGMDFCLEHKLKLFEAGAQGEHKLLRGFRPVKIFSAHKFKEPAFHEAIGQFIKAEKTRNEEVLQELASALPFKKSSSL